MEARGLISGYDGSKPRQVLISKEEWQELKMGNNPNNTENNDEAEDNMQNTAENVDDMQKKSNIDIKL